MDTFYASLEDRVEQRIMSRFGGNEPQDDDIMLKALLMERCGGKGCCNMDTLRQNRMPYPIEFLAEVLPAVSYVTNFDLELLVHGGILANNESNQKKLDDWLHRKNQLGQTNGNVIRQGLLSSITYGYSGLRRVGNDIVFVPPTAFEILNLPVYMGTQAVPGLSAPAFYRVTSKNNLRVEKSASSMPSKTLSEEIRNRGLKKAVDGSYYLGDTPLMTDTVFLPPELFCHLRHSDDGAYGKSPLSSDRLRVTATVDFIANMIDEIDNDGTDYNVYTTKTSVVGSSLGNMVASSVASNAIQASLDSKEATNASNKKTEAARKLAMEMKRSDKTHINLINGNIVEKVEKQPGTVELYRYNTIWDKAKALVADIYGISAMIVGADGGGWSTGMSSMIQFSMEKVIKPLQQRYAEQLTEMITSCAGIKGVIKFKEINWEDELNAKELEKIASEVAKNTAQANKAQAEADQITTTMNSDTTTETIIEE